MIRRTSNTAAFATDAANRLSKLGHHKEASRRMGVSQQRASQLWQGILNDLGGQAR
jgi:hypothetical protein